MALQLAGVWEHAARRFEARPPRYRSPLAMARHLDPRTRSSAALELIDQALVDLTSSDEHDALMVFIPPQEGKSTTCARRFPEWLLDHDGGLRVVIVSYEYDTARRWGRDIRQDIQQSGGELHITLRPDATAADRWETPQGGGVYSVGVGGALTGRPADIMIIDDPVKDRADAESEASRRHAWDWWESVALTRLAPGAKVVLIMTRWHEDDLAGRILARPSTLRWKVLKIPAIADSADDPLGRKKGEELVSVRGRQRGYFKALRATMSAYVFGGIYQQTPSAAEGNFFRRATFRYWRSAPSWSDGRVRIDCENRIVTLADCWTFGTVDVAASTRTTADFTVICLWAVTPEGDLILLGRAREQVAEHDHFGLAERLFDVWGRCQLYVESNFFATTIVTDAHAAGIPVVSLRADTDKVTRAVPAAGRVHAGRVWFPAEVPWLDEWTDELATFPNALHDDQVDCLAYAARVVTAKWAPARTPPRQGLSDGDRAIQQAAASAIGSEDGFDPLTAEW